MNAFAAAYEAAMAKKQGGEVKVKDTTDIPKPKVKVSDRTKAVIASLDSVQPPEPAVPTRLPPVRKLLWAGGSDIVVSVRVPKYASGGKYPTGTPGADHHYLVVPFSVPGGPVCVYVHTTADLRGTLVYGTVEVWQRTWTDSGRKDVHVNIIPTGTTQATKRLVVMRHDLEVKGSYKEFCTPEPRRGKIIIAERKKTPA